MKSILLLFPALLLLSACTQQSASDDLHTINPVIGDQSYLAMYGEEPDTGVSEHDRIAIHLAYVEQLLRQKDVSGLSAEERIQRSEMLDLLHEYREGRQYPSNYDHPEGRRPCFIDRDGNICAVGYLVEQSAGRELAEQINAKYQYDYIRDMDLPELADWVAGSGLSLEEVAMIQPTYGYYPPVSYIEPSYGISSALLGGVNMSLSALNSMQMIKGQSSLALGILGVAGGTGQVIHGFLNMPEEIVYFNAPPDTNEGQKVLSLVNIGIGTTTTILSAYQLLSNCHKKDRSTTWNVFSYPTGTEQAGVGIAMVKRF
ncbi:MAG: hypothetical protein R2767_00525 [Chitinophagales bacterium]